MRPFNFAIELWGAALDVGMSDVEIFDMPVEFGLELMTIVCTHFPNAERELFNDVVDEVDRVRLGVLLVGLEGANACCIVDCSMPETAHLISAFSHESQKFNVDLNGVSWNLF